VREMPNGVLERRGGLVEQALRLEWLTAAWMLIEAAVAISSGIAAHSLTLIAFGADSVIELLSALLLLWRLMVELRRGEDFPEELEERAAKIGALLLLALSLYVIVSAAWALWRGEGQEFSLPGIVLAGLQCRPCMVLPGLSCGWRTRCEAVRSGPTPSSPSPAAISRPLWFSGSLCSSS